MDISIAPYTTVPDRPALEALLVAYYEIMIEKWARAGGPPINTDTMMSGLWDDIDRFLPPHGALTLAHDPDGTLLGCGFLKKIRPDAAELKRLFVIPEAQGYGLGRKLIDARIEIARNMGVRDFYADTIKGNDSMLSLYAKLGFSFIEHYPENANPKDWSPWLVYLHRTIDPLPV
ncbi:GNAT family N-acetyltransferase [Litoreibacter sp.]|nr:GNAT family N-acetyltransferase [Litoreibacter sp.]